MPSTAECCFARRAIATALLRLQAPHALQAVVLARGRPTAARRRAERGSCADLDETPPPGEQRQGDKAHPGVLLPRTSSTPTRAFASSRRCRFPRKPAITASVDETARVAACGQI